MCSEPICLEVVGIYCPVVECIDTAASKCKTIGLRADFSEATFTETVRTESTAVEDECATSAGIGFLLWERAIEGKKNNEGDADR